jgi:hypothetical protein
MMETKAHKQISHLERLYAEQIQSLKDLRKSLAIESVYPEAFALGRVSAKVHGIRGLWDLKTALGRRDFVKALTGRDPAPKAFGHPRMQFIRGDGSGITVPLADVPRELWPEALRTAFETHTENLNP